MRHICSFGIACLTVCSLNACAQVEVSPELATSHYKEGSNPVYPPIAKAAQVQGTVALSILIDDTGHVSSAAAVSGPEILRAAAVEAVKEWRFTPFREGVVHTRVNVTFSLGVPHSSRDQEIGQKYFATDTACRNALKLPDTAAAVAACEKEVGIAKQFPDEASRHLEVMNAHQNLGIALLTAKHLDDGIAELDITIALARKYLKESDAEFAYPFYWRSAGWQAKGDAQKAIGDLATGEQALRLAMKSLPNMSKHYGASLASMLRRHAALLDTTGDSAGADSLRKEADSI
jgi:TonB family protein